MPRKAKEENYIVKEIKKSTTVPQKTSIATKLEATNKSNKNSIESKILNISKVSKTKAKSDTAKVIKKDSTSITTKNSTKKATKKTVNNSNKKKNLSVEYYDLPNSYNQTIVKILAQTPTILFAYWDISVQDRQNLINKYSEDFFNNTIPFLVVTNKTKNYSFEVEINDYANSWYIHIPDSDCKYDVSLIRKPKNNNINIENNYVFITSSNDLQTPNDHILFENFSKSIFFKNVKNGLVEEKSIFSLSFMQNIGKIYNIYDLYKKIYKDELKNNKLDEKVTSSKMSS